MLDENESLCSLANRFLNNRAGTDLRGPPALFPMKGQLLLSYHLQQHSGVTRVKASTCKSWVCVSLYSKALFSPAADNNCLLMLWN